MNGEEIRVGDRLRIREWDDMEKEVYGSVTGEGDILSGMGAAFVQGMKFMCGRPFTVKTAARGCYQSEEEIETLTSDGSKRSIPWTISAYMLEPFPLEQIVTPDTNITDVMFA